MRTRRSILGSAAIALCLSTASSLCVAGEVRRAPDDDAEVAKIAAASNVAAALLVEGEAMAIDGNVAAADALFQRAITEYKGGSLLQRRHCEALTALGRRQEAIAACYRALEAARSNANVRAQVRAFVSGPEAPTMSEVAMALDLAKKAADRAPGQFTPIAATCDIAASLGDGIMLRRCANDLSRTAPGARETKRAAALVTQSNPPSLVWGAWALVAGAALATAGHAARRKWRRASRGIAKQSAVAGLTLFTALATFSGHAAAEVDGQQPGMLSKWPIDDANPEASIPNEAERNEDPLEFGYWLQDLILHAEVYSNHGNHAEAAKLYTALAVAVPGRAVAFTKMCTEYEALGDREKATASCEAALLRDGLTVADYEHYVRLVLSKPGPLTDRQTKALGEVMAHMREDPAGRAAADQLDCDVGVRTSNAAQLQACTDRLAATHASEATAVSYRWSLAMVQGNIDDARALTSEAKSAGLGADRVAGMEVAVASASRTRTLRLSLAALAVVLLLAAGGLAAFKTFRKTVSA